MPLVTVLQGNIDPASDGFLWWKKDRPARLPSAAAVINKVAAEYGSAPVERCADLLAGDLSLIVGTPETDPLPATELPLHIDESVRQRGNATLPDWVAALGREQISDMNLLAIPGMPEFRLLVISIRGDSRGNHGLG